MTSADELRPRIRNEKKWELACEEQLYCDELRWGTWQADKFAAGTVCKRPGALPYTNTGGADRPTSNGPSPRPNGRRIPPWSKTKTGIRKHPNEYPMKRKILMTLSLLAGIAAGARAQQTAVTAREGTLELPTYVLNAAETAPIFERDWSYQPARRSVYPYALDDN